MPFLNGLQQEAAAGVLFSTVSIAQPHDAVAHVCAYRGLPTRDSSSILPPSLHVMD